MNLQDIASQVRRDIVRMVHGVKSGHPGGSLGCTDLLVSLYFKHMELKTDDQGQVVFDMEGNNEDVFFLSNGHISPVLYSVLAHRGYFPVPELATFRKLDSRLQGHPATAEHLPGIRIASGSLGQGLSVATGVALGKKLKGDSHLVYVLMGDGEQQEGQVWEAATFAPHHKVDNLIAFIDFNGQQIDGPTEKVMNNRDLGAKYEAFGWEVLHMDGNDYTSLDTVLTQAKGLAGQGKPIMIITKTEMGQGVDFMMHTHKWHGTAPNDEQLAKALAQLPETLGDY
ncbi:MULTISPECIES: transketolase [unclassified Siphonobacter]|uniref:transketolase n=1 Tax=unclassified Siphonobacter TaxID=2635712 RepID=UPI000CB19424|nr:MULTISPECIES: transketolase [unclassified Siphonobacter]MDQ1088513.1 transketolase [Siphonobacter sp. SORGH_AS_1065]MDR6194661.1 transketolase [Siphonobacter sp. SORGH_AS_0500]PKK35496.1 transketolase [Siphonobacter sp. SORGH_AS_0500]